MTDPKQEWPLVTAVTLIYNTNPRFVIEAIESVRANLYPNLQHIIIDDGSSDMQPKEIVKRWIFENNYTCEFYEHTENYGLCKTVNHALELAKGKYLAYCCDDILLPGKLKTEVQILEKLTDEYACVYSDAFLINGEGDELPGRFIERYRTLESIPEGDIYEELLKGNYLPAMAMLWRTDAIRNIGGYDNNLIYEDFDIHLRLAKQFKFAFNASPTAKYRIHSASLINNKSLNWYWSLIKIYLKHQESKIAQSFIWTIFSIKYSENSADLQKYIYLLRRHYTVGRFPFAFWAARLKIPYRYFKFCKEKVEQFRKV